MTPHSNTLAWKIPWTEEPGRLQSMGSRRVWHTWETSLSLFTFMHCRRKWQPTPVFLPGECQGRGILVGCRLKRLSSSSSSVHILSGKIPLQVLWLLYILEAIHDVSMPRQKGGRQNGKCFKKNHLNLSFGFTFYSGIWIWISLNFLNSQ